jgi:hypothetical protein
MAKRKRPPTESQLTVRSTTAFARRQRTEGDGDEPAPAPPDKVADGSGPTKASDRAADAGTVGPVAEPDAPSVAGATAAAPAPAKPADPAPAKAADPAPVKAADPAPAKAADPAPVKAADPAPAEPAEPAAAPAAAAPFPLMPDPSQIPAGDPDDPADAPGLVPPGDSRSLRRGSDFVLVYRLANIVVSRFGAIGRRGQFRVVEYPTTTYAANAYARECSRWVGEGYSDYREP